MRRIMTMCKALYFCGLVFLCVSAYCQNDFSSVMMSEKFDLVYKSDSVEIYYQLYHFKKKYFLLFANRNHNCLPENLVIVTKRKKYYFFPLDISADGISGEYYYPMRGFVIPCSDYKKISREQLDVIAILYRTYCNTKDVNPAYNILNVTIANFGNSIILSEPY